MKLRKLIKNLCRKEKENLQLFQGNWRYILAWPVVASAMAGSLWFAALNRLNMEHVSIRSAATEEVHSLARVYAKQIERSFEQMDELTLYVKNDWERSRGSMQLERLQKNGLFSTTHFTSFLIIGPDGKTLSSTISAPKGLSFADRPYFAFHRDNPTLALQVGMPTTGRLSGKRVIHMTRRLENPDGSFAGVLAVGMPFEFFAPLSTAPLFGKAGVLALVGTDGRVRLTGVGGEVNQTSRVNLTKVPDIHAKEWRNLAGRDEWVPRVLDGSWFSDKERRIAAVSALKGYPFQTLVALSEKEIFAPYQKTKLEVIRAGLVSSVILAFFVLAAMLLSARLIIRKASEDETRKAYRLATEGGNEGFYLWKALRDGTGHIYDFRVVDCNERGAELYGRHKQDLLKQTLSSLYPADCAQAVVDLHREAFKHSFYEDEFKVPEHSNITVEWIHRKMVRTREGLAITWRDITSNRVNEAEMARLATEDALTGLPNRYWLSKALPEMLARAGAQNASLALLFIDLDDFKDVNDTLGHSAGDSLLKAAAERLRSLVRPSDSVVRLGGDEFTVVLDPIVSREQVAQVAGRIAQAFKEPFELEQGSNFVGTSIGIGIFPEDGDNAELLTKNADIAMYSAKVNKGGYSFYEQSMFERFKHRLDIEKQLQAAIADDQFEVYYQPRVDTHSGKVVGMEALVRWQHPERGLVMPGEFIPAAESSGLVLKLGSLVLRKTCAQLASWSAAGIPVVPVSVNVSARQFNQSDVRGLVADCLKEFGVAPSLLEIELTESTMMGEGEEILGQLAELDAMGIKLHVDDFGTGYSSLALLQQLKLDVLKIDRAFTSKLGASNGGEILFHAIVSMAHALGMQVVAEGVETLEQLEMLQSLGCDEAQGYYMSKPVPAAEVPDLVRLPTLFPPVPYAPVCLSEESLAE